MQRRSTIDRKNAPSLVLIPNSPSQEQEAHSISASLSKAALDGLSTPSKYPSGLGFKSLQDAALRSPSLTPRAGSMWAAQNLSRSLAGESAHGSGRRTPSGFEHLDFGADYFVAEAQKRVPRSFEWEYWAVSDEFDSGTPSLSPSPPATPDNSPSKYRHSLKVTRPASDDGVTHPEVLKRRLGPNETSYYLGSRGAGPQDPLSGVNDMYLHIGFMAPPSLVTPERVAKIWTELRLRHTLLSSSVEYQDFEEVRFVFRPRTTFEEARDAALTAFQFKYQTTKEETLDLYLNGPRYLSDSKLGALWITTERPESDLSSLSLQEGQEEATDFHFWLLATHFLGDGMALHSTANEFFELLGGKLEELEAANAGLEWDVKTGKVHLPPLSRLPPAMETRIQTPESYGRLAWAAARVEFQRNQGQTIGGQTFPRARLGTRKTVVPTFAFTPVETGAILKKCKANGVTIAHAIFALTNLAKICIAEEAKEGEAWAAHKDKTLPMMLYSALNLRPNMMKGPEEDIGVKPDFFHLVIGYYNVTLPAYKPERLSLAQTFWLRARETKEQTVKAVKSPWLTQRSKLMCLERERRAIGFEREDEQRRRAKALADAGIPVNLGLGKPPGSLSPVTAEAPKKEAVPSAAFLGVSMLGNLDGMYKHASFPKLQLFDLTTGSRQRPGASLLFAYTFSGRLFFSLGYDQNAYPAGSVELFWDKMIQLTRELMIEA